jgi:ketosteroid isomerase-like protein
MSALSTLQATLTAMSTGDEAALDRLLADSAMIQTPDASYQGKAAAIAAFADREEVFGDVSVTFSAGDDAGVRAWAEFTVRAQHIGSLDLDGRTIEASGKRFSISGAAVADVVDDRVVSLREYYDGLDLLGALGLLPR